MTDLKPAHTARFGTTSHNRLFKKVVEDNASYIKLWTNGDKGQEILHLHSGAKITVTSSRWGVAPFNALIVYRDCDIPEARTLNSSTRFGMNVYVLGKYIQNQSQLLDCVANVAETERLTLRTPYHILTETQLERRCKEANAEALDWDWGWLEEKYSKYSTCELVATCNDILALYDTPDMDVFRELLKKLRLASFTELHTHLYAVYDELCTRTLARED